MKACFADTYFYLALLNPADEAHQVAASLNRTLAAPMVTTTWVLTEVADALSAPGNRTVFLELLAALRGDPQVSIIPPSPTLFDRGIDLYRARLDEDWSLTDCVSFVVMGEYALTDALTGDHHFEQAGFRALMK